MAKKQPKRILIAHGERKEIAAFCKCSVATVRSALIGATRSDKATQIREVAIKEFGGTIAKG